MNRLKALALALLGPDCRNAVRWAEYKEACEPSAMLRLIERGERLQEALRNRCRQVVTWDGGGRCELCLSRWKGVVEKHAPGCLAAISEETESPDVVPMSDAELKSWRVWAATYDEFRMTTPIFRSTMQAILARIDAALAAPPDPAQRTDIDCCSRRPHQPWCRTLAAPPEQSRVKPVAWIRHERGQEPHVTFDEADAKRVDGLRSWTVTPLYAAPPDQSVERRAGKTPLIVGKTYDPATATRIGNQSAELDAVDGRLHIVFDGPPDHHAPRFVECEDDSGKSVKAGEWKQRSDGYWELVIARLPPTASDSKKGE